MFSRYFPGRSGSGFTLVEILVAVAVFSVIMLTLFSTFRTFVSSADVVKNKTLQMERVKSAFKILRQDLEMICIVTPPRYQKPVFDSDPDPYRLSGESKMISFATLNRIKLGDDPREGVARVTYYLRQTADEVYVLHRHESLPPYTGDIPSCSDPAVSRDIRGMEIVYVGIDGREHTYWDSDSEEFEYGFPTAVNLKLRLDKEGNNSIETAVVLPASRTPLR